MEPRRSGLFCGNYEVCFADGLPDRAERNMNHDIFVYPEEIIDKKCGECVRCQLRDHGDKSGYHCTMRNWDIDVEPEHKACVSYWDKAEHEEVERLREEDTENRRKELWAIYAEREPIKLPIVNDGYGMIPECPICGEMPYSTEQCHWCGQRFVQDKEIDEYNKPDEKWTDCFSCGGKGTMHIVQSKYNGHGRGQCKRCGMKWIE